MNRQTWTGIALLALFLGGCGRQHATQTEAAFEEAPLAVQEEMEEYTDERGVVRRRPRPAPLESVAAVPVAQRTDYIATLLGNLYRVLPNFTNAQLSVITNEGGAVRTVYRSYSLVNGVFELYMADGSKVADSSIRNLFRAGTGVLNGGQNLFYTLSYAANGDGYLLRMTEFSKKSSRNFSCMVTPTTAYCW